MVVTAKICGLRTADAVAAAVAGGASHIGLNFYPPSPRSVTPGEAAVLAAGVPAGTGKVGLFVDADDATLAATLDEVPLDLLQLHGDESADRVAAIRARFGVPVMKVIRVAGEADVDSAADYAGAADWLLFDARAPAGMAGALPGGNALSFDWELLGGRSWPCPWMLSGGLDPQNVSEAIGVSGAPAVDVSSGVESAPGVKDPVRIKAFLDAVAGL